MRRVACDGRGIVGVKVIVEPVVVPVPGLTIEVEVTDVQIAVGVPIYIECLPHHHPLNALRIEFYPASSMP